MKKIETKSVLLVGVGGQGTILASKVLTSGLIAAGYDVKMSEVHGMSQRGGTVTTQVRFGSKVWSPLIGEGEADVLVSFETMEAMRCLPFLRPGGKVVVNTYEMPSLPVLSGECEYPDGIIDELKKRADTLAIDAVKVAADQGMPRGMNVVLLGALVAALGVDDVDWAASLKSCVKPQFYEANLKCLEAGLKLASPAA
ncbi:MAG: indolepyruvate oxidoreductase subunit beta [Pyramidobacter sp.]|nr:indolepyruvate oxidoreductase subunit beta [Pyramidobacter sp.]